MRNQVKPFKNFSAEVGDPRKSFFVAKLVRPALLGIRIKINKINKIFMINQISFNMYYPINKK